MKPLIARSLDFFIPPDVQQFEQNEEVTRARALVFILLVNLLGSVAMWLISIGEGVVSADFLTITPFTLMLCMLGYAFALWVFKRSGLFFVSGNLFALICYLSTVYTVIITVPDHSYVHMLLGLLSLPVLVSLIANHASAITWLLIIAVTPQLAIYLGKDQFGEFFFGGWIVCCTGLAFALYLENYYREKLRSRLNAECTRFEYAAAHDPLTGLANRATFDRRLNECIDYCKLHNTQAVLIYIDLDKFKPINDTYGHQAGDIVLTTVSKRLGQLVRRSDTVARLGGDEFAILFEQCSRENIQPFVERVIKVVSDPIEALGNQLIVGCSIGLVVCPDDGVNPEQLSHKADERMYANKRAAETR